MATCKTPAGEENVDGQAAWSDEIAAAGELGTAGAAARWDAVKRTRNRSARASSTDLPAPPALARAEKALSKARRYAVPGARTRGSGAAGGAARGRGARAGGVAAAPRWRRPRRGWNAERARARRCAASCGDDGRCPG
ncbi:hypothetical protein QJS66_08555 [Kocuria rhizophila]|nr:hypothetical protein QJS66_08555 [Kocuria rhizophila]